LIDLYWQVGKYISRKIEARMGDGVVPQLAQYIAKTQPGQRGFTRDNLFRMKQFYDTYRDNTIVGPLADNCPGRTTSSSLGQSKRPEEREFYLRMAVQRNGANASWSGKFKVALFEHAVLSPVKVSPR